MRYIVLQIISFLLIGLSYGQAENNDELYVRKDFLIVSSTKSYSEALKTAQEASANQNIKLDLRGLSEKKQSGLTLSEDQCQNEGWEYPAYYARGRWDDGVYISIEYSDAFTGFKPGYYIVVVASGNRNEYNYTRTYNKIKKTYKSAYSKSSKVYVGCMH